MLFFRNPYSINFPLPSEQPGRYCLIILQHADLYSPLSPKVSWYSQGNGEPWKQKEEEESPFNLITVIRQDHFK